MSTSHTLTIIGRENLGLFLHDAIETTNEHLFNTIAGAKVTGWVKVEVKFEVRVTGMTNLP
jgi:hypothetical protein